MAETAMVSDLFLRTALEGCLECSGDSLCHRARRAYGSCPLSERHMHTAALLRQQDATSRQEARTQVLGEVEEHARELAAAASGSSAHSSYYILPKLLKILAALKASSGEEQP